MSRKEVVRPGLLRALVGVNLCAIGGVALHAAEPHDIRGQSCIDDHRANTTCARAEELHAQAQRLCEERRAAVTLVLT
jgi:hypothetical protein